MSLLSEFDFTATQGAICGPRKSGKTSLSHELIRNAPSRLAVWDPSPREYAYLGNRRYQPRTADSPDEINKFLAGAGPAQGRESSPYDLIILDDATQHMSTRKDLPPAVREMRARSRHWGLSVIYIVHRPVDLHPALFAQLDWLITFRQSGDNDIRKLESMCRGLGRAAAALPPHHFAFYTFGEYSLHSPVPEWRGPVEVGAVDES